MSAELAKAFAMNQRRLRQLRVVDSPRPGNAFNGEGYAVWVHVLDRAAPEPGSEPPRYVYFESLEQLSSISGVSKTNAQRALKRFVAVGLLVERGMEHHSGYQATMTYEVNVDLLCNGEGLAKWSTPSGPPGTPKGSQRGTPEGSQRGTPKGSQRGTPRISANATPTTETVSNLNKNQNENYNSNRNSAREPDSAGLCPCRPGCSEESNPEHRANVIHLTEALIAFERRKTEPKSPVAWERFLAGKYGPIMCRLEPVNRERLRGSERRNETNRLIDKARGSQ